MTGRIERRGRLWLALGAPLGFAVLLAAAGCGGGEADGGDANFTRKFEKPAGPIPEVKAVPDPHSKRDANELSPRERRALNKAG